MDCSSRLGAGFCQLLSILSLPTPFSTRGEGGVRREDAAHHDCRLRHAGRGQRLPSRGHVQDHVRHCELGSGGTGGLLGTRFITRPHATDEHLNSQSQESAIEGLSFLIRAFNLTVAEDSETGSHATCPAGTSGQDEDWLITQGRAETVAVNWGRCCYVVCDAIRVPRVLRCVCFGCVRGNVLRCVCFVCVRCDVLRCVCFVCVRCDVLR